METITLYQWPPIPGLESASPFCNKIHYALRYKRLRFEVINLSDFAGVGKLNSRGKLPVLACDGRIVADSTEIIRFIETRHPEPAIYPPDEHARALALILEDWADDTLYWHLAYERWQVDRQFEPYAAQLLAGAPSEVVSGVRRVVLAELHGQGIGRLTVGEQREKLAAALDWLDHLIDAPFLCGVSLSVADIAVAAQVDGLAIPLTPWPKNEIEKRGNLRGWLERVKAAVPPSGGGQR